jgi:hypothetical protein
MTAVPFAKLLIRGVALWLVCSGIGNLSLLYLYRPGDDMALVAILNSTIFPVITGVVVWSGSTWLAGRMVSAEEESVVGVHWTPEEALRVAVAIVGLVILTDALRELVWRGAFWVKLLWAGPRYVFGRRGPDEYDAANLVSAIVRATLGVFLVLKPRAVVAVVGRGETPTRRDDRESDTGGRTRG